MLRNAPICAYIPASDVTRARKFYEGIVGLEPREEYAGGVVYQCGGAEVFLYPTVARLLLQDYLNRLNEPGGAAGPALTPREKEILRLLAEGYSNKEIADRLVVSPSTIHSHRSNLMKKLNLSSRHDLIQYARERGLLPSSG